MPPKIERFTVRAKWALTLAQTEAEKRHHTLIDTEHLLLGILREPGSIAIRALSELDIRSVEAIVEELAPTNESAQSKPLDLSPHIKKLLEFSVHEVRRRRHHYINPEHLLLAMIRQSDTKAVKILKQAGLNLDDIRNTVDNILSDSPPQIVDVFGTLPGNKRFNAWVDSLLTRTQITAKNLNCMLLDTHHLLLGLLQCENPIVQQVFAEMDISYKKVMQVWLQTPAEPEQERMQLSSEFEHVFKRAIAEADALNQWQVGSEHFLLSLMALPEGEVVDLLGCLGTNPQKIREHTFQVLLETSYHWTAAPERFIQFINRTFGTEL